MSTGAFPGDAVRPVGQRPYTAMTVAEFIGWCKRTPEGSRKGGTLEALAGRDPLRQDAAALCSSLKMATVVMPYSSSPLPRVFWSWFESSLNPPIIAFH